ncbi:MAG: hypothetical protein U1C46_11280 [Bacteroidales bacterium]|nr:hypothetical protein [Bacteroidales bacterium]
MENTNIQPSIAERQKSPPRKSLKWLFRLLFLFIAVFILFYFIMSAMATLRWVKNFNKEYTFEAPDSDPLDPRLFSDSAFISLQKQLSFSQARLDMAHPDSIGLSINLANSTMNLEIEGVTVHTTHIISYRVSRSIYGLDHYALARMLSEPLLISESSATIPKEPIMVKKAPKDTIEATLPDIMPDTSTVVPVFFRLSFKNDFQLLVLQEETIMSMQMRKRFVFLCRIRFANAWKAIKDVIRFRVPTYSPEIRIIIPSSDARIIYRALPENGMAALMV